MNLLLHQSPAPRNPPLILFNLVVELGRVYKLEFPLSFSQWNPILSRTYTFFNLPFSFFKLAEQFLIINFVEVSEIMDRSRFRYNC